MIFRDRVLETNPLPYMGNHWQYQFNMSWFPPNSHICFREKLVDMFGLVTSTGWKQGAQVERMRSAGLPSPRRPIEGNLARRFLMTE